MANALKKLLDPRGHTPLKAYKDAKDHGGDPMKAVLDPNQHFLDSGPRTAGEARKADVQNKAKFERKRKKDRRARTEKAYAAAGRKAPGYKKGGQVKKKHSGNCCRGMGCATRGGRYNKDG